MKHKITERVTQPTPAEVEAARKKAGHTQAQAADMVSPAEKAGHKTWGSYERTEGENKRGIPLSAWELYLLLNDQHPTLRVVERE